MTDMRLPYTRKELHELGPQRTYRGANLRKLVSCRGRRSLPLTAQVTATGRG
jgi:hypothetical protein